MTIATAVPTSSVGASVCAGTGVSSAACSTAVGVGLPPPPKTPVAIPAMTATTNSPMTPAIAQTGLGRDVLSRTQVVGVSASTTVSLTGLVAREPLLAVSAAGSSYAATARAKASASAVQDEKRDSGCFASALKITASIASVMSGRMVCGGGSG